MSASAEHVYRIASAGWVHCHGQEAQELPAWPRLTDTALVVLDLDDIFTDVWRFEGKSEYAAALIEKRVRTQGLVEGAAHIVMHRLLKVPGGFQAYFSAVSLDLWQQCAQWAKDQSDHCLVMTSGGLMCHGVGLGQGRVLLSQRRLMCFVHTEEGMVFSSTQALGFGAAAMGNAAQVVAANQSAVLGRLGAEAVEFGALWSSHKEDQEICLSALQGVLGGEPVVMPTAQLTLGSEPVQSVMPALARDAASRHALNPTSERVAWRAERWVAVLTVLTAVAGIALGALGVFTNQQAGAQREESQGQREQLVAMQERIQAVSNMDTPAKLMPVAQLARTLDEGLRYDPLAFLGQLKETSGRDIRIQRVRLESSAQNRTRAFRVDGVVAPGASASINHWVAQMSAAGWTLKALEPTDVMPGAFSYELVAKAAASGNVKP